MGDQLGALLGGAGAAVVVEVRGAVPGGVTALTLMGVPASSLAYWAVIMFTAAFDTGYASAVNAAA